MNHKYVGCAAAALLCTCLLCGRPAEAVSLEQPSEQGESIIEAADSASLLPDSMDGQQAEETVTREQMCALAVRLYASLTDTDYDTLMEQSAVRRSLCPYTDTQSADVQQAWLLGLTQEEGDTFRPQDTANRQQLFAMLYSAMQQSGCDVSVSSNEIAETLYSYVDGAYVPDWAREGTTYFLREGLSSGIGEDKIGVGESVSAEQAAILTYRAAAAIHTGRGESGAQDVSSIAMHSGTGEVSWTGCAADYYHISFYLTDSFDSAPICTEQVSSTGSGAQQMDLPEEIADQPGIWYWSVDGFDCTGKLLASSSETAALTVTAQLETEESDDSSSLYIVDGTIVASPYTDSDIIAATIPDGLANSAESYSDKVARIFGEGSSYHKYANSTEAASHQVTVSVQVWDFDDDGNKITRTARFQIHEALAETVEQIFAEIYEGGEQFPIYSVGGYCWRGDSSSSEHCLGTAIDINPDENYMCTNSGAALTGTHWSPGTDPYSILADGDVVSIFEKYGFTWGGTWSSKKDYMHFSYFGT